ncbi:MAG: protein tyrosine phosphatase family protein [Acidobacteriota bacterium]
MAWFTMIKSSRLVSSGLFLLIIWSFFSLSGQAQSLETKDEAKKDSDLPKFYRIDDHYFRGAQPSEAGFRKLAEMGVKVVVDLRDANGERDDREEQLVTKLGMRYINLSISTFRAPEEEQIQRFVALMQERESQPVFVHCWRGNDRTGLITGIYRVEFYNWTGEQAYKEMKEHGFSLSFLRRGMKSYLFKYAERKAYNKSNVSENISSSNEQTKD